MSTLIRAEMSAKNKYYISKHRYYELKHYCLQYPEWMEEWRSITGYTDGLIFDPTSAAAIKRDLLTARMKQIESIAFATDDSIGDYIFEAVTTEKTYTYFKTVKNIPCGKDFFYERYRRFFWLLDRVRD